MSRFFLDRVKKPAVHFGQQESHLLFQRRKDQVTTVYEK